MALRTLLDLLHRFPDLGNREAIRYYNGYRTWTINYTQLFEQIGLFSERLQEQGIQKGDVLLLWGENTPEWVIAFWACVARGAIVVPLDAGSSSNFVLRVQEEARASLLVHGETVDASPVDLPKLSFDDLRSQAAKGGAAGDSRWEVEDLSPDDIVEIVYTSGTTGEPKGVVHRHRNLCANLRPFDDEIRKYLRYARPFQPIRILDMLPLSHMFGQSLGLFIPVFLKGAIVLTAQLHPSSVVETIKREGVSVLVAVPRLVEQLRSYAENQIGVPAVTIRTRGWISIFEKWWRFRKVHSRFGWKFWALVVGGARLDPELEEFWDGLGFAVITGYGLTEASPVVAVNHPFHRKRGSIGKVLAGQEVRIAPDGEILVRGDSIVSEYFGRQGGESNGKWLHTGDIGEVDEEGHLRFKGRKKDVIVTAEGLNVYPEDIEAVLNSFPEVREAVIVPRTSNGKERIHAVLLLSEPTRDVESLIRRANQQLESHQRIRSWSVWEKDEFPRTPSTQKVKRREVASFLSDESRPPADDGGAGATSRIGRLLIEFTGVMGELDDAARLSEDLGLSSLDRIELLSRLEASYSTDLDEEEFNNISTVGELRALVKEKGLPAGLPAREDQGRREVTGEVAVSRHRERDKTIKMPRWNRRWPARIFRRMFQRFVVLPLFRRYISLTVEGSEVLAGLKPPLLFAANHESHLDTIALLVALPAEWRSRITPAMGTAHFRPYFDRKGFSILQRMSSALQYYLACLLVNAYPLPQEMGSVRETLRYTGELVDSNYCPLVFPEGERTPDGHMRPFKPGIGLMAVRLHLTIVPAYLDGLFEVLSLHDSWPQIHPVLVRFGEPLTVSLDEDYEQVAERLQKRIRQLAAEEPQDS